MTQNSAEHIGQNPRIYGSGVFGTQATAPGRWHLLPLTGIRAWVSGQDRWAGSVPIDTDSELWA